MKKHYDSTISLQSIRLKHTLVYCILIVAFFVLIAGIIVTFRAESSLLPSNMTEVASKISPSTLQEVLNENIP